MLIIELIPVNKGNKMIICNMNTTTIGRSIDLGCADNRVSRNHAQLFIKTDNTLWIKPIHQNPTFYKTKTAQIVQLKKDNEYQLYNNDEIGLLPDEYFYRISIDSNHNDSNQELGNNHTTSSSAITKSLNDENKIPNNEDKPQIFNVDKENLSEKPSNTEINNTKQIVDNNDETSSSTSSSTNGQAHSSNETNLSTNNCASSTVSTSTKKERCPFGKHCYRKNAEHRQQMIHPDDPDWDIENVDDVKTKPLCPYGINCYRKNADHLNEYAHPEKYLIQKNSKQKKVKRKSSKIDDDDDSSPNEYDYNDSFIDDDDVDEYESSTVSENDDDDDEWEPKKHTQSTNNSDDESTDLSDKELMKNEANEFTKSSKSTHHKSTRKRFRPDDNQSD